MAKRTAEEQLVKGQEQQGMEGGLFASDVAKPATAAQLAQRKIRSLKKRSNDTTSSRNSQSFAAFQSSPTSFNFGANADSQQDNTVTFGGQHTNPFSSSQSFPPTNGAPAVGSQTPSASFNGFGSGTTFNGFGASTQPSGGFSNPGSSSLTFGNTPAFTGFASSNPTFGGFNNGASTSGGTENPVSTAFNFGGTNAPVFGGFGATAPSGGVGNGTDTSGGFGTTPPTLFNFGSTQPTAKFGAPNPSAAIFGNIAATSAPAFTASAPANSTFDGAPSPSFGGFGSTATTTSGSNSDAANTGFGTPNNAKVGFGNTVTTSEESENAVSTAGVFGSATASAGGPINVTPTVGFNFGAPSSGSPASTGAGWTTLGASKPTTASPSTSATSFFPLSQTNGTSSTTDTAKNTSAPDPSPSPSPSLNPFTVAKPTDESGTSAKSATPDSSATKGALSALFKPSDGLKETSTPSSSTPSKNIFGASTASSQPITSIFGSSTPPTKPSTNLFGASNTSSDSPSTTSVPAALNSSAKTPSTNMFSSSAAPSQSSANMFSALNTSSNPPSTNPLFAATKPSTNVFAASNTAPNPSTNMFAAAKSSPSIFAAPSTSPKPSTNPLFAASRTVEANRFSSKPSTTSSDDFNVLGASANPSKGADIRSLPDADMDEDASPHNEPTAREIIMDESTIPTPPSHFSDAQVAYYYRDVKVLRLNKYFRESFLLVYSNGNKYQFSDASPLTTSYTEIMQAIKDELHKKLGDNIANYQAPLSKPSPPRVTLASNPSASGPAKRKADHSSSPYQDNAKKAKPTPSSETAKKLEEMLAAPSPKSTATASPAPPLQRPTFGSYDPKALWKKQVEAQEAEAKKKRKAEEYDSEEDDEAEWERKDEEKQRARKAKLEEERAAAKTSLSVPSISVNGDSSRSASPASVLEAPREKGFRNDNPFAHYASTHSGDDEEEEEEDEDYAESDASQKLDSERLKRNPLFGATRDQNNETTSGKTSSSSVFDKPPLTNGSPGPRGGLFSTTPSRASQEEGPSGTSNSPESNPGDRTWKPGSAVTFGSGTPLASARGFGSSSEDPAIVVSAPTPISASPDTGFLFGTSSATPKFVFSNTLQDKIHLAPSVASSQPFSDVTGAATPKSQDGESDAEEPGSSQFVSFEPEKEEHDFLFETELAKALKYIPDSTDEVKWKTQGLGPMVVLKNRETGVRNIVMKATPSGQVVLNTRLFKEAEYKKMTAKRARFTVSGTSGLETWLVQFKGEGLVDEFVNVCEQNKS